MLTPDLPENLTSGGASLARRAGLEDAYSDLVEPEIAAFLTEVDAQASAAARSGNLGTFGVGLLALWVAAGDRIALALPAGSGLVSAFRASELPGAAISAAQQQLAQSAALALSAGETVARVSTSLGLLAEPVSGMGGAFGRLLLNPEGTSVLSWEGASEALARTSATADYASEMIEQLRRQGYSHKRWMTRYDSRVRETHANADRTTILLDDNFTVGGASLRYPADPMSEALSEVINCRCVLVGVKFGRHELAQPEGTTPWNNPRPS